MKQLTIKFPLKWYQAKETVGNCTAIRPSCMPNSLSGTVSNIHKHYNNLLSKTKGLHTHVNKLVIPVLLVSFFNNTYT